MKGKYVVAFMALFACSVLIVPTTARAATDLGMQLSSNGVTETLCDQDMDFAGCTHNSGDLNPNLGVITFLGGVDKWSINVATGTGAPVFSLPQLLDLNDVSITSGMGNKALTLTLTEIGLANPLGMVSFLQTIGGTSEFSGTTINIQSWYSASNTAFCVSTGCGTKVTNQNVAGNPFSGSATGNVNIGGGPYSVTMVITIDTQGNADTTSFDSSLDIPEPATLSVLGAALLGLGTGIRRKLTKV
jgi:PEP-CTERM motif